MIQTDFQACYARPQVLLSQLWRLAEKHFLNARRVPGDAAQSYIYLLRKLADALVQFIERHLVHEERPLELGVVVHVRDPLDRVRLRRERRVELLWHGLRGGLELLEKGGRDGEEVDAGEGFDLADLRCGLDDGD